MEIKNYEEAALKTLNKELNKEEMLLNGLMGLNGEAGEAIDLLKKHLFHGHELNKEKLILELGDIAWYLVETCSALDISLEEVLKANIEKLEKRYSGEFSKEKSINRKI